MTAESLGLENSKDSGVKKNMLTTAENLIGDCIFLF